MSGKSYDPKMEKYPLLISYPRSGSNWLNCVLELYFDRPRLRLVHPTFLKDIKTRNDFMWFHDHDIYCDLSISHSNIMYLYRNPDDVIFSLLKAEHDDITKKLVNNEIKKLIAHYHKYLLGNLSKVIVKYEVLKSIDYVNEFNKLIAYLGQTNTDKHRLDTAMGKVKKDKVIRKQDKSKYFNKGMLSNQYETKRSKFKQRFKKHIYSSLPNEVMYFFDVE